MRLVIYIILIILLLTQLSGAVYFRTGNPIMKVVRTRIGQVDAGSENYLLIDGGGHYLLIDNSLNKLRIDGAQ